MSAAHREAGRGPINLNSPQQFSAKLPDKVDVVIIGGGIIGVSTALYLAEQKKRVFLCEKGRIAGEQSSRNWGWIRQQGRDAAELPLMKEAIQIWQGLARRCQSKALHFEQQGIWYLADCEADLEDFEAFMDIAREHSLDTQILGLDDLQPHFPKYNRKLLGALHTPSDGRAEPWVAVPAMAKAAEKAGAMIREHCAVRNLLMSAGTVQGVITESGSIEAEQVVLAGGAWSSLFAKNSGINLPQLSVLGCAARVEANIDFHSNALDNQLAFRRRLDGGFNIALCDHHDHHLGPDSFRHSWPFRQMMLASWRHTHLHLKAPSNFPDGWLTPRHWNPDEVSPFERQRVLEPIVDQAVINTMIQRLKDRFPSAGTARVTHAWAGMIDATPDVVPVIDQLPQLPHFWIATGFSGHGFGIGPAIGRILADLLQGKSAKYDMTRFRFNRFSDGSSIVPGPAL